MFGSNSTAARDFHSLRSCAHRFLAPAGASCTGARGPHSSLRSAMLVSRYSSGFPGYTGAALLPPASNSGSSYKQPRLSPGLEIVRFCAGCVSGLAFTSPVRGGVAAQMLLSYGGMATPMTPAPAASSFSSASFSYKGASDELGAGGSPCGLDFVEQ